MKKALIVTVLLSCCSISFAACSTDPNVYVQSVLNQTVYVRAGSTVTIQIRANSCRMYPNEISQLMYENVKFPWWIMFTTKATPDPNKNYGTAKDCNGNSPDPNRATSSYTVVIGPTAAVSPGDYYIYYSINDGLQSTYWFIKVVVMSAYYPPIARRISTRFELPENVGFGAMAEVGQL